MNPKDNPYAPGAGTQPPELTGRDQILGEAEVALARVRRGRPERGILLTGLRGVGKTVLLNRIRALAQAEGFIADLIEAPEERPLANLIAPSLRQALVKMSATRKAEDMISRGLRVLKSFTLSMKVAETEVSLRCDPEIGTADSGNIERDLSDLLIAVGEAALENDAAVAILIDEIQYLSRTDLGSLIVGAHRIAQRNLPLMVMGAGLPLLPALSGDARSYAERLFRYPKIGALEAEDAKLAISAPAKALGVTFEDAALDEIVRMTRGYPYFIQEWGYVIWNAAPHPTITAGDVIAAGQEATARLDESFFRVRLDRVTDAEKRYLRAMAELGESAHRTGDIAKLFGRRSASFGPVRDTLIKKGMIYSPRHGTLDFTVPLFGPFMKRTLPDFDGSDARH